MLLRLPLLNSFECKLQVGTAIIFIKAAEVKRVRVEMMDQSAECKSIGPAAGKVIHTDTLREKERERRRRRERIVVNQCTSVWCTCCGAPFGSELQRVQQSTPPTSYPRVLALLHRRSISLMSAGLTRFVLFQQVQRQRKREINQTLL